MFSSIPECFSRVCKLQLVLLSFKTFTFRACISFCSSASIAVFSDVHTFATEIIKHIKDAIKWYVSVSDTLARYEVNAPIQYMHIWCLLTKYMLIEKVSWVYIRIMWQWHLEQGAIYMNAMRNYRPLCGLHMRSPT